MVAMGIKLHAMVEVEDLGVDPGFSYVIQTDMLADSFNQTGVGDGRPHAARAYDADLSLPLAHCGETSSQQTNIKALIGDDC